MKIHRVLIPIAGAALLAACDRPDTRTTEDTAARIAEDRDQALVRVIHAMPEAPQSDIYADEERAFPEVRFGTVTPYRPVSEDQFKLTMKASSPAGAAQEGLVLVEARQGLEAGGRYTILAMPDRDGALKLDAFADEIVNPPAGKALVRVIHAAPDAGSVAVYTSARKDDPELDDVDYGAPARYTEIDPQTVSVSVESRSQAAGGPAQAPAVVEEGRLEAGKVYTLVVAPGAEPGKRVHVIRIEDTIAVAEAAEASGKEPAIKIEDAGESYEPQPDVERRREEGR